MPQLNFRPATINDSSMILQLIHELANFEGLSAAVIANEELLKEWLFERQAAEVQLAELDGQIIGYALFFTSFSTFLGRSGLYLEDLYSQPAHRQQGYGRAFFLHIKKIAQTRSYGRMEWACLDWNQAAIDFYEKQGAEALSDWTTYRISL